MSAGAVGQTQSSSLVGRASKFKAGARLWDRVGGSWAPPLELLIGLGLVATLAYCWTLPNPRAAIPTGFLLAGLALVAGALIGFLFGIPRFVQATDGQGGASEARGTGYRVNTNLEQISDWLTKIIVGVGLVEVRQLLGWLDAASVRLAGAFAPAAVPPALAAIVVAYFVMAGFFACYLWTRLFLTLRFSAVEERAKTSPEFFEGMIQALLYQPPPDGFLGAIEAGENYLRLVGEDNWRVWRSLACAYGQKYSYLMASAKEESAEAGAVKKKAYDAIRRVLTLNPEEKHGILALASPDATPQENDLQPFWNDPEFKNLFETAAPAFRAAAPNAPAGPAGQEDRG